jgi:hypothetical protein
MFHVRKIQTVAIAAAAVFCFAAADRLAAQDTGHHTIVYHVAGGTFGSPQVSGNDLLELNGNPFMVSVIASGASRPVKHGKGYAIFHGIEMRGAFTSTMNPGTPLPVHCKKGVLFLSVGNPNYDELKYSGNVKVTGIKLAVQADVHAPKGTLAGFLVKPFSGPVTLAEASGTYNMTISYSGTCPSADNTCTTVLGVSAGTLTGTDGKP